MCWNHWFKLQWIKDKTHICFVVDTFYQFASLFIKGNMKMLKNKRNTNWSNGSLNVWNNTVTLRLRCRSCFEIWLMFEFFANILLVAYFTCQTLFGDVTCTIILCLAPFEYINQMIVSTWVQNMLFHIECAVRLMFAFKQTEKLQL